MITFTPSNRFPHKSNDKSNRCQRPHSSIRIVQHKVACQKNEFHLSHRRNQAVAVSYHLRDLRINVLFEISINIDMGQNTDTLSLLSDQLLHSIEEDPRDNENTKILRYHLMVRLLIQDKVFTANWACSQIVSPRIWSENTNSCLDQIRRQSFYLEIDCHESLHDSVRASSHQVRSNRMEFAIAIPGENILWNVAIAVPKELRQLATRLRVKIKSRCCNFSIIIHSFLLTPYAIYCSARS